GDIFPHEQLVPMELEQKGPEARLRPGVKEPSDEICEKVLTAVAFRFVAEHQDFPMMVKKVQMRKELFKMKRQVVKYETDDDYWEQDVQEQLDAEEISWEQSLDQGAEGESEWLQAELKKADFRLQVEGPELEQEATSLFRSALGVALYLAQERRNLLLNFLGMVRMHDDGVFEEVGVAEREQFVLEESLTQQTRCAILSTL
ncbi:unnamed protein product, partial [Effrenium voratum]